MQPYAFLADLILVAHFSYVAFVVVGLALVWVGHFLRWRFVRSFSFRALHLLSMAVVVLESVFAITCPLTTWENRLRELAGQSGTGERSFVEHWLGRVLFLDLAPSTFTVIYVIFFVLLVLSFVVVRPRVPRWLGGGDGLR